MRDLRENATAGTDIDDLKERSDRGLRLKRIVIPTSSVFDAGETSPRPRSALLDLLQGRKRHPVLVEQLLQQFCCGHRLGLCAAAADCPLVQGANASRQLFWNACADVFLSVGNHGKSSDVRC